MPKVTNANSACAVADPRGKNTGPITSAVHIGCAGCAGGRRRGRGGASSHVGDLGELFIVGSAMLAMNRPTATARRKCLVTHGVRRAEAVKE